VDVKPALSVARYIPVSRYAFENARPADDG